MDPDQDPGSEERKDIASWLVTMDPVQEQALRDDVARHVGQVRRMWRAQSDPQSLSRPLR